jgi:hypothetical protein
MTSTALIAAAGVALLMASGGFAMGLLYFAGLRRTIDLVVAGRERISQLALTLGRIGTAAICLGFAGVVGAVPLLATFVGFLLARNLAMRTARRAG